MRQLLFALTVVSLVLASVLLQAQIAPGIFSTLQTTSAASSSLKVGCAVGAATCAGGIVAGQLALHNGGNVNTIDNALGGGTAQLAITSSGNTLTLKPDTLDSNATTVNINVAGSTVAQWTSSIFTLGPLGTTQELRVNAGSVGTTVQGGFFGTRTANDMALLTNNATIAKLCNGGGITVGNPDPTGGCKGNGTINISADIYKNNAAYTNPRWAFQRYYTGAADTTGPYAVPRWYTGLMPLKDHRDFVRVHHDLPLMLHAKDGGMFERGDMMLASLEEAYLYIYQLEDRISKLEAAQHKAPRRKR